MLINMKKIICIALALVFTAFAFTSCSSKNKEEPTSTQTQTQTQPSYAIVTDKADDETKAQTTTKANKETTASKTTAKKGTTAKAVTKKATTAKATAAKPQTQKPAENKGSFSSSDVSLRIKGKTVKAGSKYANYSSAFGTPSSVTQAPSCHYSGMDNIYSYSGFTVYTYFSGSDEIIYDVEVTSSSYSTSKGVKVGDSVSKIKECYGNPKSESGDFIEYSSGSKHLSFYISGGRIDTIEISAD